MKTAPYTGYARGLGSAFFDRYQFARSRLGYSPAWAKQYSEEWMRR